MNVVILSNAAPFVKGGAEALAETLVLRLRAIKGIDAELLRIPFRWDPPNQLIQQIILNKNLRLANVDRVIAMKFPAYLIPHENKTLWLMHQYRQAYDLDREGMTNIPSSEDGDKIRRAIRIADSQCFQEAKNIFTISPVVSARLRDFNSTHSTVLHHPLNDPENFKDEGYNNFIFAGGRVGEGKRQHILIDAMRHSYSNIKLVIAGPPETDAYAARLRAMVADYDLEKRVELKLGYWPRAEIIEYVNNARACVSIPIDEDSMSYVAMEAFAAGKSVITATDSGGLLELVKHLETGLVVPPEPSAIGNAFDHLASETKARKMGLSARNLWRTLNITWSSRIERLLS